MASSTLILFTCFLILEANGLSQENSSIEIPIKYSELAQCIIVSRPGKFQTHSSSCEDSKFNTCTNDSSLACSDWLMNIQRIFAEDRRVIVVDEHHVNQSVGWLFDSLNKLQSLLIQPSCSVVVYSKPIRDRKCLMSPVPTLPTDPIIIDHSTLPQTINQINNICHTFRNTEGDLNTKGLHREYILDNLFSVKHLPNHVTFGNVVGADASSKPTLPSCEKVTIESWDDFFMNYLQASKPVIIKNVVSTWDAFTFWTNSYLKAKYGNMSVHVKLSPTTDYEGVEQSKLWEQFESFNIPDSVRAKLEFPDFVVPRPAPMNMKFTNYLELMKNISDGIVGNVSAYLEYSSIRQYFPDLEKDISEMPFLNKNLKLKHLNIWLSDGNTLGKLHFDPFDNFLCMIDGKKELLLFEPHNNSMLYETHIPEAQFSVDLQTYQFRRKELLESTSMVMSPFDIKKPDFKRFPEFKSTLPLNCTIEAGEVLFMPAFWWHEVQSFPSAYKRRNLAINFWYEPFLTKEFPCATCHLDVNPFYNHLL